MLGKAKILASIGGLVPGGAARGGVVHMFKSEFKAGPGHSFPDC